MNSYHNYDFKSMFEESRHQDEQTDDEDEDEGFEEDEEDEEEQEPIPGSPGSVPRPAEVDEIKGKSEDHHRMFQIHHVHFPFPIQILIMFSLPWELFIIFVIFDNLVLVVYMAFFEYGKFEQEDSHRLRFTTWGLVAEDFLFVVDCILAFDVLLRLSVETWRARRGILCVVFILQYTFTTLVFDIFTLIPWDTLFILVAGTEKLSTLYYVGFVRLYQLVRYRRVHRFFREYLAPYFFTKYFNR